MHGLRPSLSLSLSLSSSLAPSSALEAGLARAKAILGQRGEVYVWRTVPRGLPWSRLVTVAIVCHGTPRAARSEHQRGVLWRERIVLSGPASLRAASPSSRAGQLAARLVDAARDIAGRTILGGFYGHTVILRSERQRRRLEAEARAWEISPKKVLLEMVFRQPRWAHGLVVAEAWVQCPRRDGLGAEWCIPTHDLVDDYLPVACPNGLPRRGTYYDQRERLWETFAYPLRLTPQGWQTW